MSEYAPRTSDVATLLAELLDLVEQAKSVPLSSSVLVSRDELVELIAAASATLPQEIERARHVLNERDAVVADAEREANALLDEARAQAAHLVSRTEVVRQANSHADRVVADAEQQAAALRREAEDYIDKKLAAMEIVVDRVARTLAAGRAKLRPQVEPEPEDPVEIRNDLFDQDVR